MLLVLEEVLFVSSSMGAATSEDACGVAAPFKGLLANFWFSNCSISAAKAEEKENNKLFHGIVLL